MASRGVSVIGGGAVPSRLPGARRLAFGGAAVFAGLLVLAAASFACSPAPANSAVTPTFGEPASQATVQGWGYGTGPVEIRWGSATGPVLATTSGFTWSKAVTIPASPPGYYQIVVLGSDNATGAPVQSAATFKVTGPAASTAPPSGSETTSPADPAPADPAPTASAPAASTSASSSASAPAAAASAPAASSASAPATASPGAPASPSSASATLAAGPAVATSGTTAGRATSAPSPAAAAVVPIVPAGPAQAPATASSPAAAPADAPAPVEALPQPWSSAQAEPHGLFEPSIATRRHVGAGIALLVVGMASFATFAFAAVLAKRRLVRAGRPSGF